MLVCPKCQCKNPLNHKFCQKCGISLTQKVCPECGTQIEMGWLNCHECGAKTGKTWWGTIVPKIQAVTSQPLVQSEAESTEVPTEELFAIDPPISETTDPSSEAEHLDILSDFEDEEDFPESDMLGQTAEPEDVPAETDIPPNPEVREGKGEIESSIATEDTEDTEDVETLAGAAVVEASEKVVESAAADVLTTETTETTETETTETSESVPSPGDYLDDRQRYQLIELKPESEESGEWQGSVLDRQPLQVSPLLTSLSASPGNSGSGSTTVIQSSMLPPAIAEPYLQLRDRWSPIVPLIHDAWENQDYSILLIEDRSGLTRLIDRSHQLEIAEASDCVQILQWFEDMTQLWQVLTPWNCRQSLLNIDNLLVDPVTGDLRLQRLYSDRTKSVPLSELGKIWQQLLPTNLFTPETDDRTSSDPQPPQPPRTSGGQEEVSRTSGELGEIVQLIDDVMNEEILTPEKLLATIQTIAHPDNDDDDDLSEPDDTAIARTLDHVAAAGATDVGRQRNHNEDDFAIDTQIFQQQTAQNSTRQFRGTYIVCDGMGGHDGGEVASAKAVKTLQQYFATHWQDRLMLPDEATIRQAILQANQAIYDLNQEEIRSGSGRMGTTLVMALVNNDQIAVAHVGDSRLYRLSRSTGLQQITVDHEVGQREIQRGIDPEMAYSRPDAYQLTQALGPRPENFVQPDIQFLQIEEDSLFILASDGLTDNDLLENHLSTHLQPLLDREADLTSGVQQLIDLANDYNGHDNITAIVIRTLVKH